MVIYEVNGGVLLLERCKPQGYWQSVTGSLEWDEEPRQTAVREVHEETGLEIKDLLVDCKQQNHFSILPAWRSRYAPDVATNLEHVFRVMLPDQAPVCLNSGEHVQAVWLSAEKARLRVSSGTNRDAIEKYVLISTHP